jgi:hypothetical protein
MLLILALLTLTSVWTWAGELSVAEPASIWNRRTIRVCWSEAASPQHFGQAPRKAVQETIQEEFTRERTGIEFTGWQSCQNLTRNEYDVVIHQSTVNRGGFFRIWGQASIGPGDGKLPPHVYLFFDEHLAPRFRMDPLEHLRMIALHEFGHLAGLRHEHLRAEARALEDPSCLTGEVEDEEVRYFGEYDRNSIMNYCWNQHLRVHGTRVKFTLPEPLRSRSLGDLSTRSRYQDPTVVEATLHADARSIELEFKIGLSRGDVATLRSLYP